jgi:ATP-dependent Lon protease
VGCVPVGVGRAAVWRGNAATHGNRSQRRRSGRVVTGEISPHPTTTRAVQGNETLRRVRSELDRTHQGLEEQKESIIDMLAVTLRRLEAGKTPSSRCIVLEGPPGTGKTTFVESMARALEIPMVTLPLAGISAPFELSGCTPSYTSATTGLIADAYQRANCKHFVMLCDELDKLASGGHNGAPYTSLLVAFDPKQNDHFVDLFLGEDEPLDLSQVIWIATANDASAIPEPLLNRIEVISIPSYDRTQRRDAVINFMLPKALDIGCFSPGDITIDEGVLASIIDQDRDPGMRSLERTLERLVRRTARRSAEGARLPVHIDLSNISEFGIDPHQPDPGETVDLGPGCFLVPIQHRGAWRIARIQVARTGMGQGLTITPSELAPMAWSFCQLGLDALRANRALKLPGEILNSTHHVHIMGLDPTDRLDGSVRFGPALATATAVAALSHWTPRSPRPCTLAAIGLDLLWQVVQLPSTEVAAISAAAAQHRIATILTGAGAETVHRVDLTTVRSIDDLIDRALQPPVLSQAIGGQYL